MDLQSESLKDSMSDVNSPLVICLGCLFQEWPRKGGILKKKSEAPYARIFISMFLFSAIFTLNFQKLFLLVAAIFGFILMLVLMSLSFGWDEKKEKVNTGFLIYSQQFKKYCSIHFSILLLYLYTMKKQKCKWLKSIYYCIYCILWLKRASKEYFKYDPAISWCGVTLIRSDWCPVPIFVHLRILFLFLLVLSTVLGFSFIYSSTQVIPTLQSFPL